MLYRKDKKGFEIVSNSRLIGERLPGGGTLNWDVNDEEQTK